MTEVISPQPSSVESQSAILNSQPSLLNPQSSILNPQSSVLHPLSRRLRSLADMRGIWSLADQGILSLGNFLTGWLLLRHQVPWYGNYFTIISIIWFLNNLHMALVTYPISVTSAGITDSELRRRGAPGNFNDAGAGCS